MDTNGYVQDDAQGRMALAVQGVRVESVTNTSATIQFKTGPNVLPIPFTVYCSPKAGNAGCKSPSVGVSATGTLPKSPSLVSATVTGLNLTEPYVCFVKARVGKSEKCVAAGVAWDVACPSATQSIRQLALTGPNSSSFTIFALAARAANLTTLGVRGPIAVLSPTNQAFIQLFGQLNVTLNQFLANTTLAKTVVEYQVILNGATCIAPLQGSYQTILQGYSVSVNNNVITDGIGQTIPIVRSSKATNGQTFVTNTVPLPFALT